MKPDVRRSRRVSLPARIWAQSERIRAVVACWIFGCRESTIVSLEPEVFGAGLSGGEWHGVEARCPRCGRVEYRATDLLFPRDRRVHARDDD